MNIHKHGAHTWSIYIRSSILSPPKRLDLQDIDERVIGYGWTDDGKNPLVTMFKTEDSSCMYFDLKENFKYKEM